MLNAIWIVLVLGAVLFAALSGTMGELSVAILPAAEAAIALVIKLTGAMMLFLGLVRVASEGGLLRVFVRALRPLLRRLFPEVPEEHPAMGAMLMNFAANMLGLGNAATPFGIKAIVELDKLNPQRGSATNAMALFLAINTSSIVLMAPTGTVAVRMAAGSEIPFAIWIPTLIATACSTLCAVLVCLALQRLAWFRPRPVTDDAAPAPAADDASDAPELPDTALPTGSAPPLSRWRVLLVLCGAALIVWRSGVAALSHPEGVWPFLRDVFSTHWVLPILVFALVAIGFMSRVAVYDAMIAGAREALQVALRIAPYLVAILVAVAMFRASGALDLLIGWTSPLLAWFGVPAEVLPLALLRPLSGSGAFGVMTETLQAHGPDSFIGLLASTLMGSTETTFYVLAVYLGAVGVRDSRHILPACLAGDLAGFIGAVAAAHLFFG